VGRFPTHAEVLDHVRIAVFATDAGGRITSWNTRAAELFGWSADQAIGRPRTDVLAERGTDMPVESGWQGTRRLRARNGSLVIAFVRSTPVRDERGACIGSAATAIELGDPDLAAAIQTQVTLGRNGGRPRVLSPREREILALLARGLTGEQIAQRLVLSPETIRTHIRNAREKLGASTRVEAVTMAVLAREIEV
jgi:PAS domain S-box-containing protein